MGSVNQFLSFPQRRVVHFLSLSNSPPRLAPGPDEPFDVNVDDASFDKLAQWQHQYGDVVGVKQRQRQSPALVAKLGGPSAWASLKPEAVRIVPPADGHAKGRVAGIRYLGAATRIAVAVDGGELAAIAPAGQPAPAPGDEIGLAWAADALHIMEGEG